MRRCAVHIRSVLLILVAIALLAAPFSVKNGMAGVPDHITLSWVSDPYTTQTITWRTEPGAADGQVEYTEAVNSVWLQAKKAAAAAETVSTNIGDMAIHTVTLSGLKPGTRYLYRVSDGGVWSDPASFKTATPNQNFSFLVFGDSQSINYATWEKTLQQAYRTYPGAAFMINVGDLVDVGQDASQWNGWFDAGRGVIENIAVMPAVGNHETYTPERRFSLPRLFTAQLKLPQNGPDGLKGQVYSFDYGDMHVSVLDSQIGEESRFIPDMLELQKAWLERDLALTDKKWKIVVLHRPPYDNRGENPHIRNAFVPIFDAHHVDVVFTGHDHVYARTYPLHGGTVMGNAAQGTIYTATGRSGTKTYSDPAAKTWDEFFYNPLEEPNYLAVEVEAGHFTVQSYTQSGGLIDRWSISK